MAKLSEILKEMDDDVKVQFLNECTLRMKDKVRTKDTEITFVTQEATTNDLARGGKTAVIVWVDKDKFNEACSKINGV